MKTITLVYTCDAWHTRESKVLHGAFESLPHALDGIATLLDNFRTAHPEHASDYPPLDEEDLDLLCSIKQTQNYAGYGEFLLEEVPVGELQVNLTPR